MYISKNTYDVSKYNFANELAKIFNVQNLANISSDIEIFKRESDQSTIHHKLFYDRPHAVYGNDNRHCQLMKMKNAK